MTTPAVARVRVDHSSKRRAAYPPIEDQLDAIWKILATLPRQGWPEDAVAILEQVQAVKTTIPKPIPFKETDDGQHP